MICNLGGSDRTARFVLGAAALAAGIALRQRPAWRLAMLALGTISMVEGAVRFCPLKHLLRINTCPRYLNNR